ncbi:MAG: DNA photolyase family protein [Alphaproteobacteria bacterium]|nr:DNA photolyase family protein [Alphaproteobacteria bacterium]
MQDTSIIWLRRDLRLDDHFAFRHANDLNSSILPIFIFDTEILKNFKNKEDKRISFILDRILFLNSKLKKYNSKIHVFHGKPIDIISKIISKLKPKNIIAGAGYEPYDIKRDKNIQDLCERNNVNFILDNDHLIFPPNSIVKDDGTPYKVFTPYSRKLYSQIDEISTNDYKVKQFNPWKIDAYKHLKEYALDLSQEKSDILDNIGYSYSKYEPWNCEFQNSDIKSFKDKLYHYKESRDFMSEDGTSKFSPYLRFGFISIRACLRMAISSQNAHTWINELIWRDFYAMAIYFSPESVTQEVIAKFRKLEWNQNEEAWKKFTSAQTGYPIVDASVRQLKEIGWVHNRARMIAASFLTKHLLIDWRKGEEFYSQHLMDYELSSNVGGWQWAASTGFDAQPYFRIFNPYLQSKKFDPQGKYIKKYLPALNKVDTKDIHSPKDFSKSLHYPEPIVQHEIARKIAIDMYKNC